MGNRALRKRSVSPAEGNLTAPLVREHQLFVFDTHPIQYRAPLFRRLSQTLSGFKVFYFDSSFDGSRLWFRERGKIPKQIFAVPMQEGFQNEVLGVRHLGLWGFYRIARDLLESYRPESILVFGYFAPENWILWWLARRTNTRMLFLGETFQLGRTGLVGRAKKALLRTFFAGVDGIIAHGKKSQDFYRALGITSTKIEPAKYCVDNAFFESTPKDAKHLRSQLRKKLGIPASALVVLFVGRLFHRKRPEDVVALHKKCAKLGVHTVVVGNGELEESLRSAAAGVRGIHFLGFKNQYEVRDLYQMADMLYVPSEMETWGLVVNEACASGMTAMVTDTCGVANDLIVAGETGFVFPVGDIDSAFRAVTFCLDDPRLLNRLKKQAREKTHSEYGVDQFAEAIRKSVQRR